VAVEDELKFVEGNFTNKAGSLEENRSLPLAISNHR